MDDFEQAKRSADGLGEFIGADTRRGADHGGHLA